MRHPPRLLLIFLAVVLPVTASAQTLDECLALARQNAPALQSADAGVARAEQAIREARAALAPSLRLGASLVQNSEANRTSITIPGAPGPGILKFGSATALDLHAQAQVTLYSGGRDAALVRAAEAARAGQGRVREQAAADLTLRVSQAYYRALAAHRLEAAARDAVDAARAHRATSAARVRAGAAPRLDSLRAQVDLEQRGAALVRAAEAVRIARVELESAIGTTLDPERALAEPGPPSADTPDLDAALRSALAARSELAVIGLALRENGERLEANRAALKPQVSLTATAQYLGPNRNETYWDLRDPGLKTYKLFGGVALSLPILDGGLIRAREGELSADGEALRARRHDTELAIRREIERALSDERVGLTVWRSDSSRVAAAGEALRLAEEGYRGGTATATDVRDAEAALADARAGEAQSLMDYWTARASLDHATGAAVRKED